jgi:tRNA 2-thiouridine synthesizing protein D
MKIGLIISNTDPELVWNALRFANTAILEGHPVKIFLLGAGVEIEGIRTENSMCRNSLRNLMN